MKKGATQIQSNTLTFAFHSYRHPNSNFNNSMIQCLIIEIFIVVINTKLIR
jgi:hypothetical protein